MAKLICDFESIIGDVHKLDGSATITSGNVRAHVRGRKVIVPDPVTKDVNGGRVEFDNVAPGPAVLRVEWETEAITIRCFVPDRAEVNLADLVEVGDYTEAQINIIREYFTKTSEASSTAEKFKNEAEKQYKAALKERESIDKAKESAESASKTALKASQMASNHENESKSILGKITAEIEAWKPQLENLKSWQPQYEWLRNHAETSFAIVQEKINQAAQTLIAQVKGDVEAAKRDAANAGQHSLKAQASAKLAESSAQRVVDAAIAKLKGNAPEMLDTLEELAERVKTGGTLEAEILQKLSKMADSDTVKQLKSRLDSLNISSVKGLSEALAGKANSSHTHRMSDITGLEDLANNCSRLEGRVSSLNTQVSSKADRREITDMATKSDVRRIQNIVEDIPKIQVVSQMPRNPNNSTIYLVR